MAPIRYNHYYLTGITVGHTPSAFSSFFLGFSHRLFWKTNFKVVGGSQLFGRQKGKAQDLSPLFIGVAAEARASFLLEYYLRYGEMLPYSGSLVQGSAPPNPATTVPWWKT